MMRSLLACLLVLVVGLAGAAPAVAQEPMDSDRLDAAVSAVVDKHHLAGLALAVVDDAGVTLAEGYGSAGDGRPVTPDTPMAIGSITKSFTAVAVLQLVEQGLVDVDAPVRTYLPWFEVADPAASEAITVRDLLRHTSGLSEFGYNRVLDPETTLEDGVRDLRSARPTAPVGDTYQYFSANYWTLALVIETVTGRSYGDYVSEHIFRPLGMTRSYADPDQARAAGLAQGHSTLFGFAVPREQPFRRYAQGSGYLVSTARDLGRFLLAVAHDGAYDGGRILSADSVALMRTPQVGGNESTGLGWGFDGDRWEASGGADETFNAQLMWSADLGRGFVWLMNQQHLLGATSARQDLNGELTALLAGEQAPAGGMSMRTLGLAVLGVLLVAVVLTVRSLLRLRGWTRRSRGMTPWQVVRAIAPHVVVPALLLFAVYRLAGQLLFGVDWAFNFRYVGAYLMPDIALLLLVAIVPDLLQAAYMTGAVAVDRFRARGAPGRSVHRHGGDHALGDIDDDPCQRQGIVDVLNRDRRCVGSGYSAPLRVRRSQMK